MSLYKPAKSPFYHYDFQISGHRFHGSTQARNKKDAEAIERQLKAKAKADVEQAKRTGNGPLTLDEAAGRYWNEKGKDHSNANDTWRDITRLIGYFGKDKRLDEINDADVAALVAWRRRHTIQEKARRKDGTPMPNISPATVNRTTTLVLKTIIGRAKRTWRYSFPLEPIWRDHLLEEPEERVREMHDHEANALDATFRDDYWPWYEFARLTGLRRKETLLRWSNVTWNAGRQAEGIWGQISILGKNDRRVTTPITTAVKELLESLIGHNAEWVFTYVAQKTKDGRVRGARYPITTEGAKTTWRRTRAKAGITDFRFHDIRHDLATKVLRTTGNLKLTQKMLNHADIKTTARYAHVLDEEVAVALQAASESRNKSRKSTTLKAQAA